MELSRQIWGTLEGWTASELLHHQEVFPEGQFVATLPTEEGGERVVGMAVSLLVDKEAWPPGTPWRLITDHGRLSTHDPSGDLLYAAGVAVDPSIQGRGIGTAIYRGREALVDEMGLRGIRAGARIPGYGEVAHRMTPEAYIREVARGLRTDPTLSFQLARGFRVTGVARNYLLADEESGRAAAIVEWRPRRDSG